MTEKRIHERSPIELAASYGIAEETIANEAQIVNFSTGGFCFYTNDQLKKGREINLVIEISEQESLSLRVKVAWSKDVEDLETNMVGVQIVDTQGDDYQKFLDFHAQQVL